LPATTEAIYERETKMVRCVTHGELDLSTSVASEVDPPPATDADAVDAGVPGASARREFERRRLRREERIRTAHPKIGGLIHALTDDPQSTKAWDVGAVGEERLGRRLNELADENLKVLHDRRIRGTRTNIDHLAVTPTGVYVIDAKKYRGRPHLQVQGGFLRPRVERLLVGTRDCTRPVDGVIKQLTVVRGHIPDQIPRHGVLCFIEADWPLIGSSFTTRTVQALWPKKLYSQLASDGPIDVETIAAVHHTLATALPRA
jgi:hypothetical protein